MNAETRIAPEVDDIVIGDIPSAELVVAEPRRGDVVLFNRGAYDQFEAKLREDLASFVPDLSTATSRKAIASKAFEVTKVKTTLEKQAKALTEEWRTKTKAVNDGRNLVVDRLDALAAEVRKPLTDWEEAERARIAECQAVIDGFVAAAVVTIEDTAATVRQRGSEVYLNKPDQERFGDMYDQAFIARGRAIETLKAALTRLEQEEADRAELEKLRAENEARAAKDVAEREAREQAEREAEAARQADADRITAEQIAKDREEQIAKDAAAKAQREAEERHAAELQAERDRAAEIERAAQVERDRVAAAEAERERQAEADRVEAARIAAEDAKRAKNQAHRAQFMGEAKIAIMAAGSIEEAAAVLIVKAIVADRIPHVSLEF